jgi:cobaltochelatase CobS
MATCLECGYQAKSIVRHIEKKHEGLKAYFLKHNVREEDVIDEDHIRRIEQQLVNELQKLKICGVELPVQKVSDYSNYVPKLNSAYQFPEVAEMIAMDILESRKILLVGETGTGKTSLINQIGARCNQPVIRQNLNGQTTISDFVGFWTAKNGSMEWIDGVLPLAMRKGFWIILDEIDFAEPHILSVLNSVLEENGVLTLKEKGHEIVEPHPNFRIFATANTIGCMQHRRAAYQGTNIMNQAFLDRWHCYKIDYLPSEQEEQVLTETIKMKYGKTMSKKLTSRIVSVANMIRKAFDEEEIQTVFSTRLLIDWTEMLLRTSALTNEKIGAVKAAEFSIFSKCSKEDAEVIKGIIVRNMGTGEETSQTQMEQRA